MAIIIATIAFILCWAWIEISLFIVSINSENTIDTKKIAYKKFIWILRYLGVCLFISTLLYMYFVKNIGFREALQYCLGIIK